MKRFNEFSLAGIDGKPDVLGDCNGHVVLAVNVASECGFTPQYAGLESLYRELRESGLVIVGFPCNQFGAQEPGNSEDIQAFCTQRFGVSFPLSEKIEIKGPRRHPLYAWLTAKENGFPGDIEWNFEKFLIGRDGLPKARYPSATEPGDAGLLQDLAVEL